MDILSKQDLRERILTLLRNQKQQERLTKSLIIAEKLFNLKEYRNAQTVLFYASFDGEVETFEMIKQAQKQNKRIGLPKIEPSRKEIHPKTINNLEEDLEEGPYNILQPKDNQTQDLDVNDIDLVVVPGVAFDKSNHRLGRGGGYYDRFLTTLPGCAKTVGLAFDFQMVDSLPQTSDHDVPVSCVVSN